MDPNLTTPNDNNPRPTGPGSVDGFMPSAASGLPGAGSEPVATPPVLPGDDVGSKAQSGQQLLNNMPAKSARGGAKAMTTILVVLFLLAAAGAGYLYWQYSSVKNDLNDEKSAAQSLSTQLSDTQASAAEQAAELQTKTEFITELDAIAQQLKTQCGTACNSITIPTLVEDTPADE